MFYKSKLAKCDKYSSTGHYPILGLRLGGIGVISVGVGELFF